jgi:hypothetical protein
VVKAGLKIDDRAFRRSLGAFAANSRKAGPEILRQQAKLFVRDAAKITPPNTGKWNRKGGEAALRADIAKILRASNARDAADPAEIHARYRSEKTGRVTARLKDKIKARGLAAYAKAAAAKVGILASGWNAAAARLGAGLPAWIARHGTKRGSVTVRVGAFSVRIGITNRVPFAGDVDGLIARVESALARRSRQMDRQVENFALRQAARKAGLKAG